MTSRAYPEVARRKAWRGQVDCRWSACGKMMLKKSIKRHMLTIHLGEMWKCQGYEKEIDRNDTYGRRWVVRSDFEACLSSGALIANSADGCSRCSGQCRKTTVRGCMIMTYFRGLLIGFVMYNRLRLPVLQTSQRMHVNLYSINIRSKFIIYVI